MENDCSKLGRGDAEKFHFLSLVIRENEVDSDVRTANLVHHLSALATFKCRPPFVSCNELRRLLLMSISLQYGQWLRFSFWNFHLRAKSGKTKRFEKWETTPVGVTFISRRMIYRNSVRFRRARQNGNLISHFGSGEKWSEFQWIVIHSFFFCCRNPSTGTRKMSTLAQKWKWNSNRRTWNAPKSTLPRHLQT